MNVILKAYNSVIGRSQNVKCSGNALHFISEEDASVHQGEGYHFGKKLEIPPGAQIHFGGIVGSNYRVHFQALNVVALTGPIEIDFRRNCEVASGSGTEQVTHNRRFDISGGSEHRIFADPTVVDSGELVIETANVASPSVGGSTLPAENAFFHGFILDTDTTALIFMRNTDTSTATVWANFTYQEPKHL